MWDASTIVTIVGILVTAAGMLITGTWRLRSAVAELKDAIAKARDEVEAKQEKVAHDFGETVRALKEHVNQSNRLLTEHIHKVETWVRDEFVRNEPFGAVTTRIERAVSDQFDKLDARLDRMENKIDTKT